MRFLKIFKQPTSQILGILNHNVIGTPGHGMLYQHLCVNDKIHKIADPYFVTLEKSGQTLGMCCFCKRKISNQTETGISYYVRYFSFRDAFRRKTISGKNPSRNSALREEIKEILGATAFGSQPGERFFHYAYVDPRNLRSVQLCKEFGFESIRQYTTVIFNRMAPKKVTGIDVQEISSAEQDEVKRLLATFYAGYNMLSFENLFSGRQYYVVRDNNQKIVAGVQVNPEHWKVLSLPGVTGKFILNIFSKLPGLKKLINKDYRFLTLEGIYHAPGHEQVLEVLFEDLLARYRHHSAIAVVDAQSKLYHTLKSLKLGWVEKLNKEVRGDVICKFFNFSDEQKERFKEKPAYISGIDVT